MGLFRGFGSFAEKIWETVKGTARPIAEAFGVAERLGYEPEPSVLRREFREAIQWPGVAERTSSITESEYIPHDMYREGLGKHKRTFSYQVTLWGEDPETGESITSKRWTTFSREMEVGEVLDIIEERFGAEGEYPAMDIAGMSLTRAEYREGDYPW